MEHRTSLEFEFGPVTRPEGARDSESPSRRVRAAESRPPPADEAVDRSVPPPESVRSSLLLGIALAPSEVARTALLFGLLFLAGLLLVVGRSARDALFLTKFPVQYVAVMWMAYAPASSLAALAYTRLANRIPRTKFVVASMALAALSYGVLRALMGQDVRAAYAIFAVWSEVVANFTAVIVWTIAQDLHDARSAKRLFGIIGSGYIVGTVVSGFVTGAVVHLVGTDNLLFVLIAALIAIAILSVSLARRFPLPAQPREQALVERVGRMPTWRSRYVRAIVLSTFLLFIVLTIGDYQFKAIARSAYPDRDALARYMAYFYGAAGALGLVVQLAITPRVLHRFGVLVGIVVMPLSFVASTLGLLVAPSLSLATIMKMSDNGLQFTIHESTLAMLYFPFPRATRDRVRALVAAIFKPLGCGVGAAALLLISPRGAAAIPGPELVRSAARLGLYTIPIAFLIVGLAPLVRRGYVGAMRRTLVRREVETDYLVNSPGVRAILRDALSGPDSPQVLFAIERLRELEPDIVRDALPELVSHRSPRVRALALALTFELGHPRADELARSRTRDPDATVRVAAVEALAAHAKEDAHDELLALADREGDPATQSAAIAALIRYAGLDGMLDGAPRLRALLDSDTPADRVAAARVLGMVGEATLQRALARLLADADADVRRAAMAAASNVRDARLLPQLVAALAERSLAPAAARAIAAIGPPAIAALESRLADPSAPRLARLVTPRVLARIGTRAALDALLAHIDEPDEAVRQKVLASASRLRLALRAPAVPFADLRERALRELDEHAATRTGYIGVRPLVARPLLDDSLVRRLRKSIIRILRLCELAYPREVVAAARAHLFGSDSALRANALEVLESLLDRALRERLVESVEQVLRIRSGRFPAPPLGPRMAYAADWLAQEIRSGDPYRATLALDAIAHHRIVNAASDALAASEDADPLVREAAAVAIATTQPLGARRALARLADDADRVVAETARYCLERGRSGLAAEGTMYTTVEKVLFLQRVPVFARVAGDDLVALARGSVVVHLAAGEVVFREGDPGGALYFIISGAVRLTVHGREVSALGANEVFGEMSIFDREPRAVTAVVTEDAELLRVSAEDFQEAVRDTAEIAVSVIQVLNRRLREADRRLATARARLSIATKGPIAERPLDDGAGARPSEPRLEGETPPPIGSVDEGDLE